MSQQSLELEELEELESSDANFDAGFDNAPTETPELAENTEIDPVPQEVEETQPEEPKLRQITEEEYDRLMDSVAKVEELNARVSKQIDTAFGKIGGVERVLKQFQEETPLGQSVEITEDDLAEIREEFPELLGPQLAMLKRVAGKMRGTGKSEVDEARIQELMQPSLSSFRASAVTAAMETIANETLDATHEGWRETVGVPDESGNIPETEYRKWLAAQPEEYRAKVLSSFNPTVIGRSIDKFQDSLKAKADSQRRNRFEQAVTERGDGGPPLSPDDDDQFQSGFDGR